MGWCVGLAPWRWAVAVAGALSKHAQLDQPLPPMAPEFESHVNYITLFARVSGHDACILLPVVHIMVLCQHVNHMACLALVITELS